MNPLHTFDREKIESVKPKNPNLLQKIGLIGPFGGGNLGDAAIQQSMISNLRRFNSNIQIYGFSIKPQDTELRHGITTYPINKAANSVDYCWWKGKTEGSFPSKLTNFLIQWNKNTANSLVRKVGSKIITNILEILALVRAYQNFKQLNLDSLIVSGGGQLDDYWGGAWGHPFTLLTWCLFAKISGTKFLIVSVGAAPINQPLSKLFTRITLSLADYRSYRDEDSQKYIREVVGFEQNDPVFADLAFSLPTDFSQKSPKNPQDREIIGIGAMSYFNPKSSWPEKDEAVYIDYLNKLATFAVWLTEQNYDLALFPGQTAHDKLAIEDFKALLKQKGVAEDRIIEKPILTVDELMNQLIDLDFVIASRFHGVLLSLLIDKPVLALSYHPKIDMLMQDTGQSKYCLEIDNFQVDVIKDKFNSLHRDRQAIKAQLASKTQEYKSSLAKQYDYIFKNF
ncbi:polysaccharide pyruvyl transferase family protein [Waterburya agarophytonicola K14]|uniref:Polysaccharide pyruvyl transferase family protein n=1 Tax=Waterburya agarophytonicola KI4 TaxID=2874699 RepID=A0A964BQ60_9CYAN|nr:polysaccharide pyruvyl transferase family protein [Waterburya agarophytonicola]MCC0176766.1 polysaccharide pyruvyl transferase family protein [Waterburya agarophytonicola KI4]